MVYLIENLRYYKRNRAEYTSHREDSLLLAEEGEFHLTGAMQGEPGSAIA